MFRRIFTFLVILLCATAALAAGKVRTWTNTDGRTMQAEFVREVDGDVTFLKDGKLIVIPLDKLSELDQQAIKDLAAGKEPQEDPFTTPAAVGRTPGAEKPADQPVVKPMTDSDKSKQPITPKTRTWTDRFGSKSSGKYVRMDGNDVVINRGTRVITVAFENLSDGDQEYVREVLISQGKEDAIPTGTDAGVAGAGGQSGPGVAGLGPAGGPGLPTGIAPPAGNGGGIAGGGRGPRGGIGGPGPGAGPGIGPGIGMPQGMNPPIGNGLGAPGPPNLAGVSGLAGPGAAALGGPNLAGGGMIAPGGMPGAGGPMGRAQMPSAGMMPMPAGLDGTGPGALPGAGVPGTDPASLPTSRGPGFSGLQVEEYSECSKCKAKLSKLEASGSTCPRCQATWGFKQDEFGNKTMTAAGQGQIGSMRAVIVIFAILGTIVFIALFVGIIVAIVKATSSPSRPPQPLPQQRYY